MADEYASGEYRYWHLSVPSPELTQAIEDGWFPTRGRVLDLGCGAGTEVGFLPGLGATSVAFIDALASTSTTTFRPSTALTAVRGSPRAKASSATSTS